MSQPRHVTAADGQRLAYRVHGEDGAPPLVLLHATLSAAAQLTGLAHELARGRRVLAVDRRGSGASRLPDPRRIPVPEHVADVIALLDAEGIAEADIAGHSFGGVVALEVASHHPGRVRAIVAWEPPYRAVAPAQVQAGMRRVAREVDVAFATEGARGAARAFIDGVTSAGSFDSMPERTRAFLESEGAGAFADAALAGLDPEAFGRVTAPVTLLGGGRSEPFYRPILDTLVALVPGARVRILDDCRHTSPITEPVLVAAAILAALDSPPPEVSLA